MTRTIPYGKNMTSQPLVLTQLDRDQIINGYRFGDKYSFIKRSPTSPTYLADKSGKRVTSDYHDLAVLHYEDPATKIQNTFLVAKLGAMSNILAFPTEERPFFLPITEGFHMFQTLTYQDPKSKTETGLLLGLRGAFSYILSSATPKDPYFMSLGAGFHDIDFRPDIGGLLVTSHGASRQIVNTQGVVATKSYEDFFMKRGKIYGKQMSTPDPELVRFIPGTGFDYLQISQKTYTDVVKEFFAPLRGAYNGASKRLRKLLRTETEKA